MNLDSTRRRHPMWEWYLSMPVPQTAVFVAEALAPAIGNPFVLTGPVMLCVLVGWLHGSVLAGVAAFALGIPFLVAATLWAKSLEILIMLRSPIRNRGGWFAVFAAIGYVLMLGPLLLLQLRSLNYALADAMQPWIAAVPSSRALLDPAGPLGWLRAMALSLSICAVLSLPACLVMRLATARGLESGFGGSERPVKIHSFGQRGGWLRFLDDPLVRKERLWLKRDRGALIQIFGLPAILLLTQFANFHNMLRLADMTWNRLAGIVLFLAASLLAAAAPRALLSEGQGLMLTMSWPRSLEDSLRVKVRVLFALVSIMVLVSLGVVAWIRPGNTLAICGVAILWLALGLAVAEKAVTLLRTPDSSGQIEPLPRGKIQPASLGNATLALAVFTAQWQLAFAAIVMNWVFAAALWQKFRLRLAYLFDPQCEPELRPPTILSSVIAIVGLLELGAILTIPFALWWGKDAAPYAHTLGYAIAAVIVSSIVVSWNGNRGLSLGETVTLDENARFFPYRASLLGLAGGTMLALIGVGYQHLLAIIPWPQLQDVLQRSASALADHPNLLKAYAIAAVGVAPWVEEYLFRGLMFRAMLLQWGLARAAFTSAAFFTILHPWPAWPMVFALGAINALLYARCRSLLPCIVLHATYNAVLLYLSF
jgi:membrane protease YdiL (CAAX protease family)